jgi:hypothetical protein
MIGLRGRFGLILTTGDVLRITSIGALHQSSGTVLLDVLLDHGGIPDGIDLAWQPKRRIWHSGTTTGWLNSQASTR